MREESVNVCVCECVKMLYITGTVFLLSIILVMYAVLCCVMLVFGMCTIIVVAEDLPTL